MRVVSVVIPARDEAMVIADTLSSLARQEGVSVQAVVVANGCCDDTYRLALGQVAMFARAGHALQVIQIDEASKTAALNAGEALLDSLPRAFIDADVRLTPTALAAVAEVLASDEPRLAAPRLTFRPASDPQSRRVAGLLERLPPFSTDVVGGGFYAVNAAGRSRWGQFPPVIGDDAFVCSCFRPEERILALSASFAARFPSGEALGGVFTRWQAGRMQLARLGYRLEATRRREVLRAVFYHPLRWRAALAYFLLRWKARRSAAGLLDNRAAGWARAD